MKAEEQKQLLSKDLSARLTYGLKCCCDIWANQVKTIATIYPNGKVIIGAFEVDLDKVKPYLRPMSSMTEEEMEEYNNIDNRGYSCPKEYAHIPAKDRIDWLNAHHFDYRGLIEMGLALEAPEGMYKHE